jgi:hypothetical protein
MSAVNVNYIYSNYQFLKVLNFVSFFFPSKLFLVHTIAVEQSLGGVVTIVIKYLYLPSFFKKSKSKQSEVLPEVEANQFESVLLKGVANLTGAKTIVVSCFNLKKIYSLRFKRITRAVEFSDFKYSAFCHAISNHVLSVLVFSNSGARLLAEYIKLELRSSRNHNAFISFLKNFLTFLLVLVKKRPSCRIVGVRVLLSGRFNGHNRARSKQIRVGVIGLQSADHFIDYYSLPCFTKYGTFGIKVWLNYNQ